MKIEGEGLRTRQLLRHLKLFSMFEEQGRKVSRAEGSKDGAPDVMVYSTPAVLLIHYKLIHLRCGRCKYIT